jgi:hypothetical protein
MGDPQRVEGGLHLLEVAPAALAEPVEEPRRSVEHRLAALDLFHLKKL